MLMHLLIHKDVLLVPMVLSATCPACAGIQVIASLEDGVEGRGR